MTEHDEQVIENVKKRKPIKKKIARKNVQNKKDKKNIFQNHWAENDLNRMIHRR